MPNYNLNINLNVTKTGRGLENLNSSAQTGTNQISKLSKVLTGALVSGLYVAGRAAVQFAQESNQAFADFDSGARQIFTLIPGQSEEMKQKLQQDALDIGSAIGRLPDEVLPSLYQALSLGIPQDNIFAAVETASRAARAGNAELEETLVTGQSIVNAYGADIYSLEDVYDILFTTVKNGAVTFQDINAGMSAITSVAGEAHVSLEDVGAAIVTMTKQGDSFDEVSQLMSNVLTQLAIDGSTAGAAFRELAGVSFVEFMDQGNSFADALTLMDQAAEASGQSLLNIVGGDSPFFRDIQAARGLVELTGRHLEEFQDISLLTGDATGNMAEAFNEASGSMEVLNAQSEATTAALKVQYGEAMEPARRGWLGMKIAVTEYFDSDAQRVNQIRESTSALEAQGVTSERLNGYMEAIVGTTSSWRDAMVPAEEMAKRTAIATEILSQGFQGNQTELERLIDAQIRITDAQIQGAQKAQFMAEQTARLKEETAAEAAALAAARQEAFAFNDAIQAVGNSTADLTLKTLDIAEVLDGDTLKFNTVEGEVQTLRFRNINTAEIDHGEGAMPFGDEALKFTQDWVDEHPIQIGAELGRESYGRIIASVPDLEEELVRQGLAIPLPARMTEDPEMAANMQQIVMEAAAAGAGMFQDEALASRVLGGELVDLGVYYEEMAEAAELARQKEAELVSLFNQAIQTGGFYNDGLIAQGVNQEAVTQSLFQQSQALGLTMEQTALLGITTGQWTEEEAAAALQSAILKIEIENLLGAYKRGVISADEATAAAGRLAEGEYATAAAAVAAITEAENLNAAFDGIPDDVTTTITADTAAAIAGADMVQAALAGIHDKTVTVNVVKTGFGGLLDIGGVGVDQTIGGGRAGGGPVTAGTMYPVGEEGPELYRGEDGNLFMIPGQDGRVFDNQDSTAALGGNINISIDARGSVNPAEVEAAGYRGAKRAMEEAGRRSNQIGRGR